MALKKKWWEFHKANPHIYRLFEKYSFDVIKAGHKKCSHWRIMNQIRWYDLTETEKPNGEQYKISNDYIAYYARLFMHCHPEYNGFFNVKEMKR